MAKLFNLCRFRTATVGVGTLVMGAALPGFLTLSGAGAVNGDQIAYAIRDGANSEVGYGTVVVSGAAYTLTRTVRKSVVDGTAGATAISLSGQAVVSIAPSAEDLQSDIALSDGTAAAPALAFQSDDDTGLYRIGANEVGFSVGGAGTGFGLSATAFYPITNDAWSVGKSGNAVADYFGATGHVFNFGAGNYTITHSAGDLAFSGIVTVPNTGLHLLDTNASHDLIIKPGSDLAADRTLTLTTGDADRTITLTGDLAMSGAFNLTHTITGNTNVTYPTTGTLATLAGGESFSNKTFITELLATVAGNAGRFVNTSDSASVQVVRFDGDRATMADNDEAYASFMLSDDGGTQTEFGRLTWRGVDVNAGTGVDGALFWSVQVAGSLTNKLQLDSAKLAPTSNDGLALGGAATNEFSDLFGAAGFVFNLANGDWVATHSTGVLTVGTGDLRVTTAGTNAASAVTVGGTQTLTNKTLTAPKFADLGFIADANGNELIILDTVTSAVNEVTFANAATGNNPSFAATGGDTNISLSLLGKGTGGVILGGTSTNDSAAAGKIGEIIASTVLGGSAVSLTTNTAANVTSISLTAGDWDVWGAVCFSVNAATTITQWYGGITTTSATVSTAPDEGAAVQVLYSTALTGVGCQYPVGAKRISLSATTTVYLVALSTFAVNTCAAFGYIGARRVR